MNEYDRFRCCVCGKPWYSDDALRWPMHSPKCANHVLRPLTPADLASDTVVAMNSGGKDRPIGIGHMVRYPSEVYPPLVQRN